MTMLTIRLCEYVPFWIWMTRELSIKLQGSLQCPISYLISWEANHCHPECHQWIWHYLFNTLGHGQNGYHFADDILNGFSWMKTHLFWIKCHRSLFLTHWGRATNTCVDKLTIIGSDNGLSPGRRQAIIWTSAGILLIGSLRTNFSEIFFKIQAFSFMKMHLKTSSAKRRPFCFGLNVLRSHMGWFGAEKMPSQVKRHHPANTKEINGLPIHAEYG